MEKSVVVGVLGRSRSRLCDRPGHLASLREGPPYRKGSHGGRECDLRPELAPRQRERAGLASVGVATDP